MRTIWLARHADRKDFADPGWHSTAERPYDPPLSAVGQVQAQELARRLAGETVRHLFTSPFLRAVETAAPVAEALRLPLEVEPGFSEWLNREWFASSPETLSVADLSRRFPCVVSGYAARGEARFGESGEEAMLRAAATARRLIAERDGDLLIVGHGASVLGVTAGLLDIPPQRAEDVMPPIPCASLTKLVGDEGCWTLQLTADTSHLSETGAGTRFH